LIVPQRVSRGLAEHHRAIRRQHVERNIPAVVADPLLEIAAGARDRERIARILQKADVIGQPSKTAQHHIFIARQPLARTHGRLPLALEHGHVAEHLKVRLRRLLRRLVGRTHDFPRYPKVLLRAIQCVAA
jgi:hypothetical protein